MQTKNIQRRGYIRRLIRQLFSNWTRHQNCQCQAELERVLEKLQDIEDMIVIIARQIGRWSKGDYDGTE